MGIEDFEKEKESEWDSGLEQPHTECPHKQNAVIILRNIDYLKIKKCNEIFKDVEYSLYFNAERLEDGKYRITEIIVPEQEVTSGHVEYKDHIHSFGVIHKHPNACTSFSSEDEKYINANHDMSLLICNGNITGVARIRTPCGCLMQTGVTVLIEEIPNSELETFIDTVKEKIKEKVYSVQSFFREDRKDTNIISFHIGCRCTSCGFEIKKQRKFRNCIKCGRPLCNVCCTKDLGLCDDCKTATDFFNADRQDDDDFDEVNVKIPSNQIESYLN